MTRQRALRPSDILTATLQMTLRSRPRCRAIVLIVVAGLSLSACGMFSCSGAATNGGGGRRLRSRHAILNAGWAAVSPAANTLVRPAGGR